MIRKIIKLFGFYWQSVNGYRCYFVSISKGWIGYMPPCRNWKIQIINLQRKFSLKTERCSEPGRTSKENRVYRAYRDLSPNIINALIATEDVRFVEHSGIDAKAVVSCICETRSDVSKKCGWGVVPCLNSLQNSCLLRMWHVILFNAFSKKPIEWVIAVKLERYYTKEEI